MYEKASDKVSGIYVLITADDKYFYSAAVVNEFVRTMLAAVKFRCSFCRSG